MPNEVITTDPLGKTIHLLPADLFTETETSEIYDDATTVIRKPAILIEVKEKDETLYYYFRSVGWNNTLLITVRFNNNRWEAFHYVKNPSNQMLSSVLRKGKQLF
jgi:hypothetical protein